MERLVRVSSFGIQSGATAGIFSKASVEAQAAKHPGEDSAKTRQNLSTQPKPKTLRRLGRTPGRNPRTQPQDATHAEDSAKNPTLAKCLQWSSYLPRT